MVKKVVKTDPRVSVAVETLIALPLAFGFIVVLQIIGHGHFVNHGAGHLVLMILAGLLTAIPLLLFAAAAQRLPLVTLGLLFYLTPACSWRGAWSSAMSPCRPRGGWASR